MFYSHVEQLNGLKVIEFEAGRPMASLDTQCYRIGLDWESEDTVVDRLTALLGDPSVDRLKGLVIGPWFSDDPYDGEIGTTVEALVAASGQLASLSSLFIGDIIVDECEVSWIQQGDLSSLFAAFPRLEYFQVRGSEGLKLGRIRHDSLRHLRIECGGLPAEVLHGLAESTLPALESLTIYLGDSNYGWNGSVEDVKKLLSGRFPKLSHLALIDSEIQDEVTVAILDSDLLPQITSLDLSMGTFGDEGANALLSAADRLGHLKSLKIEHHYMSPDVAQKLETLPCEVTLADGEGPTDDSRYVVCGE